VTEHSIDERLERGWGRGFGSGLASIGDITGDGIRELAVGMDCYALSIGAVAVFSGKSGEYVSLVSGDDQDGHFGGAIGTGADWDGDGTDDWWVCSQPFGGQKGRGGLAVYSGRDAHPLERVETARQLEEKRATPK
jgi:hypothetical protein